MRLLGRRIFREGECSRRQLLGLAGKVGAVVLGVVQLQLGGLARAGGAGNGGRACRRGRDQGASGRGEGRVSSGQLNGASLLGALGRQGHAGFSPWPRGITSAN